MNHRTRKVAIGAGLLFVLLALGCATFKPRHMEEIFFMERAQTQEREGLRITVGDEEQTGRVISALTHWREAN